ncbi:MAG: hypothetical protein V1816_13425 [Pseudomonadota bacterium]
MDQGQLLSSVEGLPRPSAGSTEEFVDKKASLAERVNRTLEKRTDLEKLIGPGNLAAMKGNHYHQALFFESFFLVFDPRVLVEAAPWAYRTYRSHGFTPSYWPVQLNAWVEALGMELTPGAAGEIAPFFQWILEHLPDFPEPKNPGGAITVPGR